MQSRENGREPQLRQSFDDFEVKYLHIANFSEKQVSFKLKVIFSTKISEKNSEPFLRKLCYQPSNQPALIWKPFHEYFLIKNFFQKSGSVTFLPLQSPNFMQKIRKILRAFSEKTVLPTNQPTNQLLPTKPTLQDLADAGPKII